MGQRCSLRSRSTLSSGAHNCGWVSMSRMGPVAAPQRALALSIGSLPRITEYWVKTCAQALERLTAAMTPVRCSPLRQHSALCPEPALAGIWSARSSEPLPIRGLGVRSGRDPFLQFLHRPSKVLHGSQDVFIVPGICHAGDHDSRRHDLVH